MSRTASQPINMSKTTSAFVLLGLIVVGLIVSLVSITGQRDDAVASIEKMKKTPPVVKEVPVETIKNVEVVKEVPVSNPACVEAIDTAVKALGLARESLELSQKYQPLIPLAGEAGATQNAEAIHQIADVMKDLDNQQGEINQRMAPLPNQFNLASERCK